MLASNRSWLPCAIALSLPLLVGCGQKHSPGCKKAADLAAPFTDLALPVDKGRVCESDSKKTKLEFIGKDKDRWRTAIEESVVSAGFAKESCPSYCMYTRGTQRLQVIIGDVSEKWVTASLIMSAGRDKGDARPSAADKPEAAADPAPKNAVDDIPECKSYFQKLLACPPAKGPVSRQEEANIKKKELQEKLDKGRSSTPAIVARTCETFEKMLKCN